MSNRKPKNKPQIVEHTQEAVEKVTQEEETSFSSDYREPFNKVEPKTKVPKSKQINSIAQATEENSEKKKTNLVENMQSDVKEPEPEIDDFLPSEEKDEDETLLSKSSEQQEQATAEEIISVPPKHRRKYRYGIAVGSLVMIFAVIGICFLVATIGKQIYIAATDDSKLRSYDTFLTPVVMQDPQPFEATASADAKMILEASLWRALILNGKDYTNYDDTGRTIVNLGDVADACHALFGPDCNLQPEAQKEDTFYTFDPKTNTFHVLPTSSQGSFAPYTVSSKKSGSTTVLKVGYISAFDEMRTESSDKEEKPKPTKYMEFVLQTDANTKKEYVSAVRAITEEK